MCAWNDDKSKLGLEVQVNEAIGQGSRLPVVARCVLTFNPQELSQIYYGTTTSPSPRQPIRHALEASPAANRPRTSPFPRRVRPRRVLVLPRDILRAVYTNSEHNQVNL